MISYTSKINGMEVAENETSRLESATARMCSAALAARKDAVIRAAFEKKFGFELSEAVAREHCRVEIMPDGTTEIYSYAGQEFILFAKPTHSITIDEDGSINVNYTMNYKEL